MFHHALVKTDLFSRIHFTPYIFREADSNRRLVKLDHDKSKLTEISLTVPVPVPKLCWPGCRQPLLSDCMLDFMPAPLFPLALGQDLFTRISRLQLMQVAFLVVQSLHTRLFEARLYLTTCPKFQGAIGVIKDIPTMQRQTLLQLSLSLAANILLCCTLVPFVIPPFGGYSFPMLLEVLLWQGIGMVGWPFALLGMALSIPFSAKLTSTASFLLILLYPAIQFLLIRSVISKALHRLNFILLHVFVTFSFVIVWYFVLNGYDFMAG